MAGTILADDIQHSTAGSVGTEYVVRGSGKSWVNFNGTGTISARDSLSVSSLGDFGTGDYSTNFTSSFDASNYCCLGTCKDQASGAGGRFNIHIVSTGNVRFYTLNPNAGSGFSDNEIVCVENNGDLA